MCRRQSQKLICTAVIQHARPTRVALCKPEVVGGWTYLSSALSRDCSVQLGLFLGEIGPQREVQKSIYFESLSFMRDQILYIWGLRGTYSRRSDELPDIVD